MNNLAEQRQRQRQRSLRSSMSIWVALLLLVLLIFLIQSLLNSGFEITTTRIVVGAAMALLIFRQVARRLKTAVPRAAEPDPKSTLNLS